MKGVKSYSRLYGEDSFDQSSTEEGPPKNIIILISLVRHFTSESELEVNGRKLHTLSLFIQFYGVIKISYVINPANQLVIYYHSANKW